MTLIVSGVSTLSVGAGGNSRFTIFGAKCCQPTADSGIRPMYSLKGEPRYKWSLKMCVSEILFILPVVEWILSSISPFSETRRIV